MFKLILMGSLLGLPTFAQTPTKAPAPTAAQAVKIPTDAASLDKGKRIYLSTCIQCHNKDPNIKGPIGPEVIDAPYAVMEVKVVTGRYPPTLPAGFVPKRKTKAMRALPKLKDDVKNIYAWIQSVKKKKKP
jgi:mono/diheme cytochrome c family protein